VSRLALVTGGAGFIGCNLVDRLARQGWRVRVLDALARPGVERNLAWLREQHGERVEPVIADVRDAAAVAAAVRDAEAVFHLAAQVAVTTSLVDPRADFEVNVGGAINVLEAARATGRAVPVIFASTNKVYGDLGDIALEFADGGYRPVDPARRTRGIDERRPLDFHTPYGCSKGAADQYVLDYGRSFGLPTCVVRMSCIYGERQMGGEDQGWVAHFLMRAIAGEPISIFGDGFQVRDILHVDDAVAVYVSALERIDEVAGRAFNLGGGPANAVSLRTLIAFIEHIVGRAVPLDFQAWRPGDQRWFVADASEVRRALRLPEPLAWRLGVERLALWLRTQGREASAPRSAAA
jgi:CDP-paratose 2-epimerase